MYCTGIASFRQAWLDAHADDLYVKTRHGPTIKRCRLTLTELNDISDRSESSDQAHTGVCTLLEGKDSGLAPGQFAAFYIGTVCIGSGVIADSADIMHSSVQRSNLNSTHIED